MKFHQFSEIFPLIEGAEFDALVEDIKAHGLREKIWLYEGKILDGRNRFLACQKAKVKPLTRKYTGRDALAFVWSINDRRRHLNASQRAMAAARLATLRAGQTKPAAQICAAGSECNPAKSQEEVAQQSHVSRRLIQHARKVIDEGSKALQQAVASGELAVSKAASVVDLPKSEQLAAAKEKPKAVESDEPERPEWEPGEDEKLAAIDREITAAEQKILRGDDSAAAMHDEIKRQAAEIAVLKLSRDGYMNGKSAMTRLLKAEQSKTAKLERKLKAAEAELEKLRERIAIMEAA